MKGVSGREIPCPPYFILVMEVTNFLLKKAAAENVIQDFSVNGLATALTHAICR